MSGDYTRFTFDRAEALFRRADAAGPCPARLRTGTKKSTSCGAAYAPRRSISLAPWACPTPSAPMRSRSAGSRDRRPTSRSHPGRLYVDGIQIEASPRITRPTIIQPFFPPQLAGFPPAALPATGDAVVYLDVWDREVTYIEDPELLDVALGGADTTTRRQTVWQVRVDPMPGRRLRRPGRRASLRRTVDEPRHRAASSRRSLHLAARFGLSRAREPSLSHRGPQRWTARHRALQVVARQWLDRLRGAGHRGERHADDACRQPHRPRPVPALPRRRLGDRHRRSPRIDGRDRRNGADRRHRRDQPRDRARPRAADRRQPALRRQRRCRSPSAIPACRNGTRPAPRIPSTPTG